MKSLHLAPQSVFVPRDSRQAIRLYYYQGEPDFLFHYHPEYELTLTRGSVGRRLVGDSISEYARGDLVLLGPNLPHTWAAETQPADEQTAMDNFVIHFTLESVGVDFLSRQEMQEILAVLERSSRGLQFRGPQADVAVDWMVRLSSLEGAKRAIAFLTVLESLASCSQVKSLVSKNYAPSESQRDHVLLTKVIEYIHRNQRQSINLGHLAHEMRMSVPTFCRFFRRATGKSLVDYVNDWRISHACALLAETTLPILSISGLAGFDNLSHFNRQFFRRRGLTPRDYRKKHSASHS